MSTDALTELKARFDSAGQGHVFQYLDALSADNRDKLLSQVSSLDIERVNRIHRTAVAAEKEAKSSAGSAASQIAPLPEDAFDTIVGSANAAKEAEWRSIGLKAIAEGKVAVLLMAGGQGTRLGSSDPKGCYDIALPSHKALFQYQAERIARLQVVAQQEAGDGKTPVVIPWYIMTSGPTHKATVEFFNKDPKESSCFGLDKKNLFFFEQGTLPCLTEDGKVLLDSTSHIAVAPDGNGGLYAALRSSPITTFSPSTLTPSTPRTVLTDLSKRNITYIHAYCVDNCLVRVADPVFLGYCISKQADCAAKVVRKTDPKESVGVVALRGDKFSVVEYTEITAAQKEARDPKTGELAFRAANIANHFYTREFLESIASFEDQMAFHIARKKIPFIDLNNKTDINPKLIKPLENNGMKLELFVFDVFPFAKRMVVLEVERQEEFSPLKNAPNLKDPSKIEPDSPQTSRRDLLAQHKRFLEKAGATVADDAEIELSPLVTYAGEGLEEVKGKVFTRSGPVESIESLDALV